MNEVIPQLLRQTNSPFARFVLAGSLNTGTAFLLFLAFDQVCSSQLAYSASYTIGIAVSYLLNACFVFRTKISVRSAVRFPLVYVVQYVYGLALLTALISWLRLASAIAMAIVIITSVPLTFLLTRSILRTC